MDKSVIIVAGGKGERMNSNIPKQFLELNGTPILMHTINQFYQTYNNIKIIVVLPEYQIDFWKEICKKHNFRLQYSIVKGGETRFHSVKNGLMALNDFNGLVAIHDGVRPLIDKNTIQRCFNDAKIFGNSIPAINLTDSIRSISKNGKNKAEDRSRFKIIQTPQVFDYKVIYESYQQDFSAHFTDDASVAESQGYQIHLTEGNATNIKITNKHDLEIAETLFNQR